MLERVHLNASQQSPLPPVKAWIAVAKCVATTAGLLARRQIHQPRTYVDERLHFADGTSAGLPRDQVNRHRGLYEWDSASLAEAYARALRGRVLALFRLSVRESIRHSSSGSMGMHRDALLQNPAMVSAEGREDWWRLTAAQLPRSPMNRVH